MPRLALAATAAALCASAVLAAPQPAAAAEKLVCKRFVPKGTLARARKVCKPAGEWQAERDTARQEGERLTEHLSGEREVAEERPAGAPR